MALYAYNATFISTAVFRNLLTGDRVVVGSQAMLVNTASSDYAFSIAGINQSDVSFVINGFVAAQGSAIGSNGFADDVDIRIGTSGVLTADRAISLFGSGNHILNHGLIDGEFFGISYTSYGERTVVVNYGTIVGRTTAIKGQENTDAILINNHGVIGDDEDGIAIDTFSSSSDVIRNSGEINGDIYTRNGQDTFDNRGGMVNGVIYMGDYPDIYKPGATQDVVYGEAGHDLLDFKSSDGVTISLDDSLENTGIARNDTYVGFEDIDGSRSEADFLRGNFDLNSLFGFGGADTLEGMDGGDLLSGGKGKDTLSGGMGNDVFSYSKVKDGGDKILDFGNVSGNDDRFQIFRSGFDGGDNGLEYGALSNSRFQSRKNHEAQDAQDRFLFDTSDKSLWFDVDGSGSEEPVLIADLHAKAVITASDFTVV